jgi:hypothetical protein
MEATPGISLYSYLYSIYKNDTAFLLSFMFSLEQNQRRGWNRFGLEVGCWGGEVAQAMYTHLSKCKNEKINGEKK